MNKPVAITGIPKTERRLTCVKNKDGDTFYITSHPIQNVYFLYKLDGTKATKVGKASTPTELENKYVFK